MEESRHRSSGYDVEAVTEKAKKEPGWVHFGIGIFSVYLSAASQMVFWKREFLTEGSHV